MGSIMQTWTESRYENSYSFSVFKQKNNEVDDRIISYEQALREGLIEIETIGYDDGVPQVQVINNSAQKVLLFSGSEIIGKVQHCMLSISIILHHNTSAILPSFFLSSTYFFDQGMVSIQQYLRYFTANDNQAGILYKMNGKISGKRCGEFPLAVEVSYSH